MKIYISLLVAFLSFIAVTTAVADSKTLKYTGGNIVYETYGPKQCDPEQPTLLMVHCWTCNRHYWDNQIPELSKNYRVVTLDLPGHGDSKTSIKKWDFASMGKAIEAVARELKLKKFIVVGHSMGGPLALQVAADMPEETQGIICIDTLQNVEFKFKTEDFPMTEANFKESVSGFMPLMVHPKSDKSVAPWIVEQSLKADPKVALSMWNAFIEADFATMMSKAKVPIRCINAVPYNEHAIKTDLKTNRKYGDYNALMMKNVGHFPMLENSKAFNKALKKQIQKIENN